MNRQSCRRIEEKCHVDIDSNVVTDPSVPATSEAPIDECNEISVSFTGYHHDEREAASVDKEFSVRRSQRGHVVPDCYGTWENVTIKKYKLCSE